MRVIIAGSRTVTDYALVESAIVESGFIISTVVCGTCVGADTLGEAWAIGNMVPVDYYPANWYPNGKLDRSAGYRRNAEMAENADALIAIHDGDSRGTRNMIHEATNRGLQVYVKKLGRE